MFGNVKAGQGGNRSVLIGHFQDGAGLALEVGQVGDERPDIDESGSGDRGQESDIIDLGADIDMRGGFALEDFPEGPDILIEIMRIEAGGGSPVIKAGIEVAAGDIFCAGHAFIGAEFGKELEIFWNVL